MGDDEPFELLASADVLVADHDEVLRRWQEQVGLPDQNPRWTVTPEGFGTRWTYARLARDRHAAPTELEVIAPYRVPATDERGEGYPFIAEIAAAQGDRIAKLHSTVLATRVFDELVARLEREGAPHRIDGPDAALPFPRLWLGFRPGRPDEYDPAADGGIRIEVLPYDVLGYPDRDAPPRPEPERPSGTMRRIAARLLLVADLDDVLARLDRHLGWTPAGVVTPEDGSRRARMGFGHPASAVLELVEAPADGTGRAGRFAAQWGPGAYAIRLAVDDLGAASADLTARGTPFERVVTADGSGGECLVIAAEQGLGTEVELVAEARSDTLG